MQHDVTVRYADGVEKRFPARADETLLEAAEAHGVPIVSACQSGVCGTCVARCSAGSVTLGHALGLSPQEKEDGRILSCQGRAQSACTIEVDYPYAANAASLVVGEVVVRAVEQLSPGACLLSLDLSALPAPVRYRGGQFAELCVPSGGSPATDAMADASAWRSYSFAHAARDGDTCEFLVRLLPSGVMSDYLRHRAQPGDRLGFRGAKGGFHVRDAQRPIVLIAGGTGLSAVLALAEDVLALHSGKPVHLIYGVTVASDLVLTERLDDLAARAPDFTWEAVVRDGPHNRHGASGLVTDRLTVERCADGEAEVYACGPPAMIDAVRNWLAAHDLQHVPLYHEKFVSSGHRSSASVATARPPHDLAAFAAAGRGTALVIGGSIAGMAAAKVLTETFARVIVLEQDPDHRRREGRPGAAQGWHLHHLLIAGQRQLETVFPGIIDDMVRAGAFKVDMGEQYRLMLAGSWKKVVKSGIEIVCAGRPLLEWCVRRRLDHEAAIDYRYEHDVVDIVLDATGGNVIGVEVVHDGERTFVAAEFVIDAGGKNTPVPQLLYRHGLEAPALEEDCINCFYSTMLHRVPADRAWQDKVMVICYAHRPQQQYYAAQYYLDQSRTVLSTSLVGYNCYRPPRNATEFREFARLMPSPVIGDELDGLVPDSPVYNFRYPTMQRFHYEDLRRPPAGLVALGDAYASADPVSGAGMTKALLELDVLRTLLGSGTARDQRFVRRYYRSIARIADRVWSVIREQNLRYPWIKDVERKRGRFFRARNWYIDRVLERMHEDPDMYRLYLAVTHFVAPPAVMLRPRVVAKVLWTWARTRLTRGQTLIERNFDSARADDAHASQP